MTGIAALVPFFVLSDAVSFHGRISGRFLLCNNNLNIVFLKHLKGFPYRFRQK